MNKVRYIMLGISLIILGMAVGTTSNCSFLIPAPEPGAPNPADMTNWDFSACFSSWDALDVCSDFLYDNQELILGGRDFLDVLFWNLEQNLATSQPSE